METRNAIDVRIHVVGSSAAAPPPAKPSRANSFAGRAASFAGARPVIQYRKGWFWAVAIPSVLVVAVVVPLAVTVANLKQELKASNRVANPRSTALSASQDQQQYATAAECRDVIPKEPAPLGTPAPPLKLKGSKLVDAVNGSDVQLHGVNWFGFNNGKTMVDGLDAGNSTWLAADFATIVYRIKLLGFNAVRLPFKFTDLESPTAEYARPCSPQDPLSAREIAQATLPPESAAAFTDRVPTAEFLLPMNSVSGTCNAYLPNGPTTLPRFLWVVEYLVASGLYVLVDYHPHEAEMEYLTDPDIFARKWRSLWSAFNCLPNFTTDMKGRVLLDLLNEPDEYGMGWSGGSTREYKPHGSYLLAAMDAIDAVSPGDAIFFIQGGGQTRLGTSWGDGFASDPNVVSQRSLEDPNPFFKELLSKPYRKQVTLSPHFYGQSITNSTLTGHQLWEVTSQSWGSLMVGNGYCVPGGECQRFPVVVGEIGSKLQAGLDVQQFNDMALYMNKVPPADSLQYPHDPVSGWFWFCWNANSEDTGGLVEADWETLVWPKITWLTQNLNLKPWWMQPTLQAPVTPVQMEEQPLPTPQYSTKRVPRNGGDPKSAVRIMGGNLPYNPPYAQHATR